MRRGTWSQRAKLKARIAISLVVLTACFVIILGEYPADLSKSAFAMVGIVIGHWLR